MKKKYKLLLILLILLIFLMASQVQAEIREITKMKDILPEISQNTLVVFDLDNTVIEPVQTLGSDQFFGYLVDRAKKQGYADAEAVSCALINAAFIQPISQEQPVEAETVSIIRDLQNSNISVIALTARPFDWATGTIVQLESIGVDFRKSPVTSGAVLDPEFSANYHNGILFMKPAKDKGAALRSYLEKSEKQFNKVIFIDDKIRNIQTVENAFLNSNLSNINYRYAAADQKVKAFSSEIADVEFKIFSDLHYFVSDEFAKYYLNNGFKADPITLQCNFSN